MKIEIISIQTNFLILLKTLISKIFNFIRILLIRPIILTSINQLDIKRLTFFLVNPPPSDQRLQSFKNDLSAVLKL